MEVLINETKCCHIVTKTILRLITAFGILLQYLGNESQILVFLNLKPRPQHSAFITNNKHSNS